VRGEFIKYFQEQCEHTFYVSSPCVPLHDPTLLFINAGMNQVVASVPG
jgi:alanyl-tRNA synthetase